MGEAWWTQFRAGQERKLGIAIGAVPDKEPIIFPEVPRLALGIVAKPPLTLGPTSTAHSNDQACVSSELRDWMRGRTTYGRTIRSGP